MMEENVFLYVRSCLCCLLQIYELTCPPVEEARKVYEPTAIKHQLIYIPSSTCCTQWVYF